MLKHQIACNEIYHNSHNPTFVKRRKKLPDTIRVKTINAEMGKMIIVKYSSFQLQTMQMKNPSYLLYTKPTAAVRANHTNLLVRRRFEDFNLHSAHCDSLNIYNKKRVDSKTFSRIRSVNINLN